MRLKRTEKWFYCLVHHVAEMGNVCPNISRLGPYESKDEAIAAIDRMNSRNQELREAEAQADRGEEVRD